MFAAIKSYFFPPPPTPEMIAELRNIVSSHKVVVFSKSFCPFCTQTKNLLSSLGQKPFVSELDKVSNGSEIQRGLKEITGQTTVPNVFINGKHIGGNSDLQALYQKGKLQELLK